MSWKKISLAVIVATIIVLPAMFVAVDLLNANAGDTSIFWEWCMAGITRS